MYGVVEDVPSHAQHVLVGTEVPVEEALLPQSRTGTLRELVS